MRGLAARDSAPKERLVQQVDTAGLNPVQCGFDPHGAHGPLSQQAEEASSNLAQSEFESREGYVAV